jgi:hypothetical protein
VKAGQRSVFVERGGTKAHFGAGRGRLHYNLTFKRRIFRVQRANGESGNLKIGNSNRRSAPERQQRAEVGHSRANRRSAPKPDDKSYATVHPMTINCWCTEWTKFFLRADTLLPRQIDKTSVAITSNDRASGSKLT